MNYSLEAEFLRFSSEKLQQLAGRILDCLDRLSEEQIWWRPAPVQNAVGNLVLHLCGNVRQWIGHGVAGWPDVRRRNEEFTASGGISRQELAAKLKETVQAAVQVLQELPGERLRERTVIQGYEVSLLEAIYHVVEHFAQHTGQILYVTKLLTGQDLGYYRHLNPSDPQKAPGQQKWDSIP